MNLLTNEIKELFKQYPLYNQDGKGMDSIVIAKYFCPCSSATWLITEAEEQEDGDYLLFGYCHVSCWEWGYLLLSDLQNLKLPFGLTIERDLHMPKDSKVKDLM